VIVSQRERNLSRTSSCSNQRQRSRISMEILQSWERKR